MAKTQLNHWTKAERWHSHCACPNPDWLIYFSYSSSSNRDYPVPNASTIILKSPTFFVYDPNKTTLTSPRVLHTVAFSSTISMGKEKKLKFGLKLGKKFKRILHRFGHICVEFFLSPSQLAPDTQPLCLPKMIDNTKRSWDKQSERVDVRSKRVVRAQLIM